MYSGFHLFALFYALQSFVIVFIYVLVFRCIYFPLTLVLSTELLHYYIIFSPISTPPRKFTSSYATNDIHGIPVLMLSDSHGLHSG